MDIFERSQTIDPEVRAHIYSLVSAIGGGSTIDDGRYILGDDALACLKDLRRWLKLYDTKLDRYDVKRCLAEANIVRGDLLEILGQWNPDEETGILKRKVALASLEILSQLTWPITLDPDHTTVNHVRHTPVLRLAQVEYKRAILQDDHAAILRKAIAICVPSLSASRRDRDARDEGIIQMTLYFLRNVVMISQPPDLPSNGDDNDTARDATLRCLQDQDVLQLLMTIASGMGDEFIEQDVIVLDILFHMLKGIDPKTLYAGNRQASATSNNDLKKLLRTEKSMLAGYARNAPSRHNRFGAMIWLKRADEQLYTVSGQSVITSDQRTLGKMDASKKWNRPKHKSKKGGDAAENLDFLPVELASQTRDQLASFVSEFLDSCLNPLFTQLRRAIEREVDRVTTTHVRQYHFLISWFLEANRARKEALESVTGKEGLAPAPEDTSFAYIAGVLTQESLALLNRCTQRALDDKAWSDVHTCMMAFTQIMTTVTAMNESSSDDDREIADNILGRIFYEEETHIRVVKLVKDYKVGLHSFAYLDAVTEMAHVFLRTLERYSKANVDLFVRTKRRARHKKDDAGGTGPIDEEANSRTTDADDQANARQAIKERKFDFGRFAAKFVNEGCVNTFVHFIRNYSTLNTEQIKRCHRFFYRVAFKTDNAMLLFRLDILCLFHRMIKGPQGLDVSVDRKSAHFVEWEDLCRHVFRKCLRKLEERPELIVELLFTKMTSSLYFLTHGIDQEVVKKAPRPPAELEVKPGMSHEEEIGVAVGVLIDQGKLDALQWIKHTLANAADERKSWQDMQSAIASSEPKGPPQGTNGEGQSTDRTAVAEGGPIDSPHDAPVADAPQAPSIVFRPDTAERRVACYKDKYLRLLLKLLLLQRLGAREETDVDWIVPSNLTADDLYKSVELINKFEYAPPSYENERSAEWHVRSLVAQRAAEDALDSDEDGDSDIDEGLFIPGGPTERSKDYDTKGKPRTRRLQRRRSISEAEKEKRARDRARKDREKDRKIKSTLFVSASDDEDDETRDSDFLRLEAERRAKAASANESFMRDDVLAQTTKRKRPVDTVQSRRRKRPTLPGSDSETDNTIDSEGRLVARKVEYREQSDGESDGTDPEHMSDSENGAENLGTTSMVVDERGTFQESDIAMVNASADREVEADQIGGALQEIPSNTVRSRRKVIDDDDEEVETVQKPIMARRRTVFLSDDDSD